MWVKKYLLIDYNEMNCAEFIEYVLRDHFGKEFNFPQSKGSIFAESLQIRECLPKYVTRTDDPEDGDLVLMHGKRLMCHVGLFVKIGITEFVLHTDANMKSSSFHNIREIKNYGYKLEGYYKWRK